MDTTVMRLAAEKPIVIFSKSNCCISHSIKTLIYGFGANPAVHELNELPNGRQLERELLQALGCRWSVPAVFIGGKLVGGANEIISNHIQGKLGQLLLEAGAIHFPPSASSITK